MPAVKRASAVLLAVLAGLAVGCGGTKDVSPLTLSACSELLYRGEGKPDVIVVSDFPRRGIGAETTKLMVDAIEFVLRQRHFQAGEHRVGYQSCNDTLGDEPYDPRLCKRNARAYVAADDVVGIIGPWNSGCAQAQIPIVSRKEAGPLAMISPSNTFVGLTRQPKLYPEGVRSYVRVVTHDLAQGSAAAYLAKGLNARRVAVVHQNLADDYVRGLTAAFVASARTLGLRVSQFEWPLLDDYRGIARSVAAAHPGAVFLAGLTQVNAKRLVEDLRRAVGPRVQLLGPDSFAAQEIARELGRAGDGMRVTVPGIPAEKLPAEGKRFVRSFGSAFVGRGAFGVSEAAQATEVLVDAIGRSDGTRPSIVEQLFATRVTNGILGSFAFDRNGDIVPRPVGIYRFERGTIVAEGVVRVPLGATRG
jgi:branched-chain amino acid transport system substrate-binding protein